MEPSKRILFIGLLLIVGVGCSCSTKEKAQIVETILVGKGRLDVLSAPAALEAGISALNLHYNLNLPMEASSWVEENLTPSEVTTSSIYRYMYENWQVSIVYRLTKAEETIYRLTITNDQGFEWEGKVSAYGEVSELNLIPKEMGG